LSHLLCGLDGAHNAEVCVYPWRVPPPPNISYRQLDEIMPLLQYVCHKWDIETVVPV